MLVFCGLAVSGGVSAGADGPAPVIAPPEGLVVSGPTETYRADTLFEKINGQAGLYLSAGFVELQSQWYAYAAAPDHLIEVNLYNMGSLINAFAVYSQQRRDNARQIDITPFAYLTADAVFLVHGPYYVEVLAGEIADTDSSPELELARRFVRGTPVGETVLEAAAWFPPGNMERGSLAVIPQDAFGLADFDTVFTARYRTGTGRLTAFIAKRRDPQAAKMLAEAVCRHFMSFGGSDVDPGGAGRTGCLLEVMGAFELVFSTGPYVAGVHEAESRSGAEELGDAIRSYLYK